MAGLIKISFCTKITIMDCGEPNRFNLALRSRILEMALHLEEDVWFLILAFLSIRDTKVDSAEIRKPKALSNSSGSLSLKNKIDLLFDLNILDKTEYNKFLLIMEFRNQFLHNTGCNSFMQAFNYLGEDKKKNLLKYANDSDDVDSESCCLDAFEKLFNEVEMITNNKMLLHSQLWEDQIQLIPDPFFNPITFGNDIYDVLVRLHAFFAPRETDVPEAAELKKKLFETMRNEIAVMTSSEEFKIKLAELEKNLSPEQYEYFINKILLIR